MFINWLDTLHSFKSKAKAAPIDTHAAIDDDEVQIEPLLLFQRLIISGSHYQTIWSML